MRRTGLAALIGLTAVNVSWLLVDESASLLYIVQVLGHLPLGAALVAAAGWAAWKRGHRSTLVPLLGVTLVTGLAVVLLGNINPHRWVLWIHAGIGVACLGSLTLLFAARWRVRLAALLGVCALLTVSSVWWPPAASDVISNPTLPPLSLAGEAQGGEDGPFFPSAAETRDGKLIPEEFFLESQTCGRVGCHEDVTAQWERSAHHLSSFNNPWYSKSIEYMQEVAGLERPKWCAGCHDHALLFPGQFERPVAEFKDSDAANAGLGCVSCHSVSRVKGTMGNGGIELTYPPMHELATSDDPLLQSLHDFVLRLDPGPHRSTFLRPFHEQQPAEFCSSCHKVHLDEAVNDYRWMRGFNTYDNWQASGVSGQGARSFYAPTDPLNCLDCHMKHVPSNDAATTNGMIRAHDYAAANTALPVFRSDSTQLTAVESFLKSGQIRVDIFAAGEPAEASFETASGEDRLRLSTTFAVGEEQGLEVGRGGVSAPATPVTAPLSDGDAVLVAGTTSRIDVVVRTLGLGHFFPTGTVDAQEAWLEMKAVDADGRVLLWSGSVDDGGTVDPSAHFYRNLMVDARARPINKRNAFAARSVVYVNLIPPGAADVARFALSVPEGVSGEVTLTAKLHYRKFNDFYTHFSFRGLRDTTGNPAYGVGFDEAPIVMEGEPGPDVPIVTMAEATRVLRVAESAPSSRGSRTSDSLRFNDYGIGLLLQGDLHGAERAFRAVTELAPGYADGWVNLARVHVAEGDLEPALEALKEALALRPGFHKALFFRGLYFKAMGDYPSALADLEAVRADFPRDRVVLNQAGRVRYLNSDLERAAVDFEAVLRIDPEDLMAHYNLMLVHRALGNADLATAHEQRYLRFKADESSQELARAYRATDPYANNEALPIHLHGNQVAVR